MTKGFLCESADAKRFRFKNPFAWRHVSVHLADLGEVAVTADELVHGVGRLGFEAPLVLILWNLGDGHVTLRGEEGGREKRRLVDQQHARAVLRRGDRTGRAGQTRTDDDDIGLHGLGCARRAVLLLGLGLRAASGQRERTAQHHSPHDELPSGERAPHCSLLS